MTSQNERQEVEQRMIQFTPKLNIRERVEKMIVEIELVGVERKDVKITYDKGLLTISGVKKFAEPGEHELYHRIERVYGEFKRMINFEQDIINEKGIEAQFVNGILVVEIPKIPRKVREVPIEM